MIKYFAVLSIVLSVPAWVSAQDAPPVPDLPDQFKRLNFDGVCSGAVGILLNNFVPMVGIGAMIILQDYARKVELKEKQERRARARWERKQERFFERSDAALLGSLDSYINNTIDNQRRQDKDESDYNAWYNDHLDDADNSYNYYNVERSYLSDVEYREAHSSDYY